MFWILLAFLAFLLNPTLGVICFIALFIGFFVKAGPTPVSIKKSPCWARLPKEPHKWVHKNEGLPNEYMVCDDCGQLPAGDGNTFVENYDR